ncbi:helix-turn-helix transcriptional regulator [Verrucosispora sp. WMMA2044]|uniref:Helix-turn-helix domain-containing protein n=1 Tax=Verrucosispora sioxanthis TaxID=2499994 RepID=A0A6M1L899_9ACTN|nr:MULTISPECIES: helix-turn-helix transcriptional regulator [Micromonospora]NEE65341.1 helix-turn-helix domain-containing protein [Verrucosispora sioxanthis]NGM14451.1 helix-turn-helix domain-containing protein [Verrucosispora sioxanthis]WBB50037.1 helix-turn-helix transcriptional regulator [Verrucosispora sp. WMMA2044]
MPLPTSPVIRRARLGAELRQLRRREALTLEQVCERLGWASTSKLSRIELGQSRPDLADVLDLLDVYEVPSRQRDALIVIARDAATSRGWWKSLGEMGERQRTYAELEAGAAGIVEYQPAIVPGLLQTPAYARLRIVAGQLIDATVDVEADLRARAARQAVLRRVEPPRYTALLTELACEPGDDPVEVWREQLAQLLELAALPHVTIRLLRVGAGRRPLPLTPFSCYSFPDPADPRTVMLEALTTDVRLTTATDVDRYERMTDCLLETALPEEETLRALARRLDG